jgi:membrane-bound metal-dependent hydrolase YbcI (DUF457 family)
MEDDTLGKYTTSFGLSVGITSVLSALLVVVKELSPNTVLALMKNITFHHWFTHSLFVVVVFLVLGWALARMNGRQGPKIGVNALVGVLVAGVVIGGLIIAGFYLLGD